MTDNLNLQERFFKEMRENRIPLVFFTTNGVQIHGLLTDYDDEVCYHRSRRSEANGVQARPLNRNDEGTLPVTRAYLREARQKNDKW